MALIKFYNFHSKVLSFHSNKIPIIKIKKNIIEEIVHKIILLLKTVGMKGKIRAISTSKIIKIIAIKKNCIENGIREKVKKSYPHSNGVNFSRQFNLFLERVSVKIIKISLNLLMKKTKKNKIKIF